MRDIRFIAETAFGHEGDVSYLSKLVDQVVDGNSDFVKFQVLLEPEYAPDHPMASKCFDLMLAKTDWLTIFKKVRSKGKKVLILPVDLAALKWVTSESLADVIEVHSVNLFRKDFYDHIRENHSGFEVLLSISGYELESIDFIVKKYKEIEGLNLSLMFGFQAFPTDPTKLGLSRISELKEKYQVGVGYADHTSWDSDSLGLCAAAISLGATTIEKHVVLKPGSERIDYNSAVDVIGLDDLICKSRTVSSALGTGTDYSLDETETKYGDRRLKLVCDAPIASGEEVKPPNAQYRWTAAESDSGEINGFELFGKRSEKDLVKGEVIA